jgi:hypothetical protein
MELLQQGQRESKHFVALLLKGFDGFEDHRLLISPSLTRHWLTDLPTL